MSAREIQFYQLAVQITRMQVHLLFFPVRPDLSAKKVQLHRNINLISTYIQTGLISDLVVIKRMVDELTIEFCELRNQSRQ